MNIFSGGAIKSVIFIIGVLLFNFCVEDDKSISGNIVRVNEFIASYMYDAYLWNDKIPAGIDPAREEDPFAMSKKMVRKDVDPWTYMTDDKGTINPLIKNWLLNMVIYKFVNKNGFTDFKDGIAPKYVVEDDLFAAYPFGDVEDPHLAKAIAVITGSGLKAAKGARKGVLEKDWDYIMRSDLTERLSRNYGNTRHIFVKPNN